jgi:hypothetical protein
MESLINANEVWGGTSIATTSNDAITRTGTYVKGTSEELSGIVLSSYFNQTDLWEQKYVHKNSLTASWNLVIDNIKDEMFTWNLFTQTFCNDIIQLAEAQNSWTTDRHQYYPTYDVHLTSLGLFEIYDILLKKYAFPIAVKNWNLDGKSWAENMQHETFLVKYVPQSGGQMYLDIHHDKADYTVHVNLSNQEEYEGGGTWFPRHNRLIKGAAGKAILFPQVTHPHGGRPTISGKRYCLISFCNRGTD